MTRPDAPAPAEGLAAMVAQDEYPCLGAKAVFRTDRATTRTYASLGSASAAEALLADLRAFAEGVDLDDGFASFLAVFAGPDIADEAHFEALLWAQLRAIHALDDTPWAPDVAADPADPHFAFSAGGTAFFVVGLHPRASRLARRAPSPTLVFNLHEQFERLRAEGRYPRMRDRIRARDEALQGSVNPMVGDHGLASEARQYAGRPVGPHWQAPFRPRPETADEGEGGGGAEHPARSGTRPGAAS
jgi:FPC/CPF motif-containing protein YcgG